MACCGQGVISKQAEEVETLTALVGKQQARTEDLQHKLELEQLEHSRVKMAMHNAEQELLRYKVSRAENWVICCSLPLR